VVFRTQPRLAQPRKQPGLWRRWPHAPRTPSAFLQIGEDDGIIIITPAVEMGQGGHTALPMIIMEELGGSWDRLGCRGTPPPRRSITTPLFGLQATVGRFSRFEGGTPSCGEIGAARADHAVTGSGAYLEGLGQRM